MERLHWICKYPHADGSSVDWRFWSPDNTHHLVLLLKVMTSYFSTVPIYEMTEFIFYHEYVFVRGSNTSASYTGEVLVVRPYLSWIFVSTNPLIHGSFYASDFPSLVLLNISLARLFIFLKFIWTQGYWSALNHYVWPEQNLCHLPQQMRRNNF